MSMDCTSIHTVRVDDPARQWYPSVDRMYILICQSTCLRPDLTSGASYISVVDDSNCAMASAWNDHPAERCGGCVPGQSSQAPCNYQSSSQAPCNALRHRAKAPRHHGFASPAEARHSRIVVQMEADETRCNSGLAAPWLIGVTRCPWRICHPVDDSMGQN